MSQRAWIIDPWQFARTNGERKGSLEIGALPRLAEAVLGGGAGDTIAASAHGSRGEDGKLYIDLAIDGTLALECQRCLEAVEHAVSLKARFQLCPEDAAIPDEELANDRFDALPAGSSLDLAGLIEDEVLLGLPLAPRHASCALPAGGVANEESSPFAVLKQIKRPQ